MNGRADDVVFTIEFSKVSRIVRGEVFGATVTLLDGRTFELDNYDVVWDNSDDVNWDNRGILIAPEGANGSGGPDWSRWRVVPWDEFKEAHFRHDPKIADGR